MQAGAWGPRGVWEWPFPALLWQTLESTSPLLQGDLWGQRARGTGRFRPAPVVPRAPNVLYTPALSATQYPNGGYTRAHHLVPRWVLGLLQHDLLSPAPQEQPHPSASILGLHCVF